jgi:hypothetical protein
MNNYCKYLSSPFHFAALFVFADFGDDFMLYGLEFLKKPLITIA